MPRAAVIKAQYHGALVRQDRKTFHPRDVTENLEAVEAIAAAMADDPALALAHLEGNAKDQAILRERGFIRNAEYALCVYGQCLGAGIAEGCFLVADPSRPIRSGEIAIIQVRGDTIGRVKVFLCRAEATKDSEEIFTEKPDGVYVFWQAHPERMLAIAGQDLLAADLVVARIDAETGTSADLLADVLNEDDRARLADTIACFDRSPLMMSGESAFDIEQGRLRNLAKARTSSPGDLAAQAL